LLASGVGRLATAFILPTILWVQTGWGLTTVFVCLAILLLIAGTLNIIYGFGAIGNAHFFTANASFVFANLHTWGWITVILGVIQLTAGFSLFAGNAYGRVIGIFGAGLGRGGCLRGKAWKAGASRKVNGPRGKYRSSSCSYVWLLSAAG